MVLSIGGEVRAERPLVALTDVEEAGLIGRIWDSIRLFFTRLLG